MTPARKTFSILLLAGLVAGGAALLERRLMMERAVAQPAGSAGHRVRAHLQSSHVMLGTSETHMAITISAPSRADAELRPAVNLAIVIDRSGSMAGEKIIHAKQAARQLVAELEPTDRFAIVVYGSDVTAVVPSVQATSEAKNQAYRAIDAIYEDGGTNLSGGLMEGQAQIARSQRSGAVERIVLISDGLANEGIVAADELAELAMRTAERGVSITTIGVGLDFDEQTLTRMAISGRGNYYFVESSTALAELFGQELARLSATTATSVRLSVTPAPGVEILEAYGYPLHGDGNQVIVPIADLHAGETRKVVLRLRVRAERKGAMSIADVSVSLRPSDESDVHTMAVTAGATVTDAERAVLDGRDHEAARHIERARAAKSIDEATMHYEAGDTGRALEILREQRNAAAALARELEQPGLAAEIDSIMIEADQSFARAPARPASLEGKRARKANRQRAYEAAME